MLEDFEDETNLDLRRRCEDLGDGGAPMRTLATMPTTPARGPGGEDIARDPGGKAPAGLGRSGLSRTYVPADAAVRFWMGRRRCEVLEVPAALGRNGGRTEVYSLSWVVIVVVVCIGQPSGTVVYL